MEPSHVPLFSSLSQPYNGPRRSSSAEDGGQETQKKTGSMRLLVGLVFFQILLATAFYSTDPNSVGFSSLPSIAAVYSTTCTATETSPPFAVFWNLYLPADNSKKDEILESMREQLHQVARASAQETVLLHYVTIGNLPMIMTDDTNEDSGSTTTTLVDVACSQYPRLSCHHVRHHERGFEEVTLDPLYDYCAHHRYPDDAYVAYIHNKGSYHADPWVDPKTQRKMRKDIWRRHGTAAAVHPDCRHHHHQDHNGTTCNVCGLLWTPVPWNHSPGNFWSAQCSYVRRLLRPTHYDFLHNQLLKHVYMPQVEAGRMVATKRFLMGASRWSMEMWVGSHPTLQPCDLSKEPDIKDWMWQDRINVSVAIDADDGSDALFAFSTFPRGKERDMRTMFAHSEPQYRTELLDQANIRFRDYNMLGGMIVRWGLIYGSMPEGDSWFWPYYPDGLVWKEGLEKYGMGKVFDVVSEKYWDPPMQEGKPVQPVAAGERQLSLTASSRQRKGLSATPAISKSDAYNSTQCQNLSKDGHCNDKEGGAWNYRNTDGTCAHTESNVPKDGGAVRGLPTIFTDVDNVNGGGVLDFGGGPGIYLTGFRNYARTTLGISPEQKLKLTSMEPHPLNECLFEGLTQDTTDLLHAPLSDLPSQQYDIVMTFEVLEHIPVEFHAHLVQALTKMTKKWLIVDAAHPGQPGEGHIGPSMKTRDQWKTEILALVGDVLEFDEEKTAELWRIPTWPLIKENSNVFRRKQVGDWDKEEKDKR